MYKNYVTVWKKNSIVLYPFCSGNEFDVHGVQVFCELLHKSGRYLNKLAICGENCTRQDLQEYGLKKALEEFVLVIAESYVRSCEHTTLMGLIFARTNFR